MMTVMQRCQLRTAAVIPAAGLSSRMGAFKPLMPFGDSTVIEHTVQAAVDCADEVVVILGRCADEVAAVLGRRFGDRVKTVINPDYASTDMLRSVQIGLGAMGESDAFFLLPADMPKISPAVFEALASAFDGGCDVVYPVIGGRRGHPPLIGAALIPRIMEHRGEGGLRAVLAGCQAKEVAISDSGILVDLDTPDDYERVTAGQ